MAITFKELLESVQSSLNESEKFINIATSRKIIDDAEKSLKDHPNMWPGPKAGFKRLITIHKKHIANATKEKNKLDESYVDLNLEDFSLDELEELALSEEYEKLDEISKSTLASYIKKATADVKDRSYAAGRFDARKKNNPAWDDQGESKKLASKRSDGILKAVDKLVKGSFSDHADEHEHEAQWHKDAAAKHEKAGNSTTAGHHLEVSRLHRIAALHYRTADSLEDKEKKKKSEALAGNYSDKADEYRWKHNIDNRYD